MSTSAAPVPIRPLLAADLAQAHALTQALRWPHRQEDWALALAMGQGWAISVEDRKSVV